VREGTALCTSHVAHKASPSAEINVGSGEVWEEGLFGGFSPRAIHCPPPQLHVLDAFESEVIAPLMLIMPELQEMCGKLVPPLSMEHLEVDSLGSLAVPSMPPSSELSQSLANVDLEVIFAKELCDLLGTLETAIPGSSKDIVCLMSGKDTDDKTKKVKEYLKRKKKKWHHKECISNSLIDDLKSKTKKSGFSLCVTIFVSRICSHNGLGELVDVPRRSRSCRLLGLVRLWIFVQFSVN
jgi:hypothetical protein